MLWIFGEFCVIWILKCDSMFFVYLDVRLGIFCRSSGLLEFVCDEEFLDGLVKWICLYCFLIFEFDEDVVLVLEWFFFICGIVVEDVLGL